MMVGNLSVFGEIRDSNGKMRRHRNQLQYQPTGKENIDPNLLAYMNKSKKTNKKVLRPHANVANNKSLHPIDTKSRANKSRGKDRMISSLEDENGGERFIVPRTVNPEKNSFDGWMSTRTSSHATGLKYMR